MEQALCCRGVRGAVAHLAAMLAVSRAGLESRMTPTGLPRLACAPSGCAKLKLPSRLLSALGCPTAESMP